MAEATRARSRVRAKPKKSKKTMVVIGILTSILMCAAFLFMLNYFGNVGARFDKVMEKKDIQSVANLYSDKLDNEQKTRINAFVISYFEKQLEGAKIGEVDTKQLEKELSYIKSVPHFKAQYNEYSTLNANISQAIASFNMGEKLMKENKAEEAIESFNKCLTLGVYKVEEARANILALGGASAEEYIASARALILKGDYEGAKESIEALKKILPNDPRTKNLEFSVTDLVKFEGKAEHIFFHPLIAYPERAFNGGFGSKGQDDYMTTIPEFEKTIKTMYDNDYVLIDINMLYKPEFDANGGVIKVVKPDLYLPAGKKPYIISVDDINYYEYMKQDGQVFKLVLDADGNVQTYSKDMKGMDNYSKDNEIVPILDKFVNDYPDSAIAGAKGTLAVTGYAGVLGYRTDEPTWPDYEKEKAEAIAVVNRLKETGWNFASHSQGHRWSNDITLELFVSDTNRWCKEVLPIIGPTSTYIYPFGQGVPVDGEKFAHLKAKGFGMMCTVSNKSNITYGDSYVIQGRRNVDGIALRDKRLLDILPSYDIIDPVRPSYAKWREWAKAQGYVS